MMIKRTEAYSFHELIISKMDLIFDINTQYKLLVLSKEIEKDEQILKDQKELLVLKYGEKNKQGQYIKTENGGYKIQDNKIDECNKSIYELNNFEIQLPDIYFTLDELKPLELTCNELNSFYSFIKI